MGKLTRQLITEIMFHHHCIMMELPIQLYQIAQIGKLYKQLILGRRMESYRLLTKMEFNGRGRRVGNEHLRMGGIWPDVGDRGRDRGGNWYAWEERGK